jgi:hypothetical protein
MGAVEGGLLDGMSAPTLGIDHSSMFDAIPQNWQWPLVTTGLPPSPSLPPPASGVPSLLARPPEAASSPPWLLLAGLGLVAYMVMK